MKRLLFFLALPLAAQTLTPTASVTSLRPGQATTISFTLSGAAQAVAYQWDLQKGPLVVTPPVVVAPSKSAAYANSRFIVYGVNATSQGVAANGVLATAVLTVPAGTPPGPISVAVITPDIQASASGDGSSFTPGPPVVITILPPFVTGDLNGDGVVNNADVGLALNQALKIAPCTTGDVNKDGSCDVLDLILVAKQAP